MENGAVLARSQSALLFVSMKIFHMPEGYTIESWQIVHMGNPEITWGWRAWLNSLISFCYN